MSDKHVYASAGLALTACVLTVLTIAYVRRKLAEVEGMYEAVIEHVAGRESTRLALPRQRRESRNESYREEAT
jgi:hypothetical protein